MIPRRYQFLGLPAFGILFTLLIWPALSAPFTMADEHYYPWLYRGFHNLNSIQQKWNHWVTFYQSWILQGRFHPTYTFLVYVKGIWFGYAPSAVHFTVWLSSVLCGWGLFKWLRALDLSWTASMFGVAFYALGEWYGEIFLRLNTGESIGNLFLVWSLYQLTRFFRKGLGSFWPGLFLGLVAGGCKESYALLFPTLLIYSWACNRELEMPFDWLRKHRLFTVLMVVCGLLLGLGLMHAIFSRGKVFNYGNQISTGLLILQNLSWISKGFAYLIVPILVFLLAPNRKAFPTGLFIWGVCLLVTQVVAYYNLAITYSQGRFIMPAGLAFVLLGANLVECALFQVKQWVGILLIASICLCMVRNAKILTVNALAFRAHAVAFDRLATHLSEQCGKRILVVGGIEFPYSLQTQIAEKGCHARFVYARDFNPQKESKIDREFVESNWKQLKLDFKTIELSDSESVKGSMIVYSESNPQPEKMKWLSQHFGEPKASSAHYSLLSWSDVYRRIFLKQPFPKGVVTYYTFNP